MKTLLTALALMISASSFAQICSFKEELLYQNKKGVFKVVQASSHEEFDMVSGRHITGNGTAYDIKCVQHGDYTGIFGRWEEFRYCYTILARNNLLVWNLADGSMRGTFDTAAAVNYPQGTMFSDDAAKSNYTALINLPKNFYLGLTLKSCK